MARWDKFLNEASRGYGLGFQRYQQYQEAQRARESRQAMEDYQAAMQQANEQGQITLGAPQQTGVTVPGAAPAAVSTTGAPAPVAGTGASARAEEPALGPTPPARALNPWETPRTEAGQYPDAARAIQRNVDETVAGYRGPTEPPKKDLRGAALLTYKPEETTETPGPPIAGVPDKSTASGKQVEQQQIADEVLPVIAAEEPAALQTMSTRALEGPAHVRRDSLERARQALEDYYILNDDVEGLMGLEQRFYGMQQQKVLNYLQEAGRLYAVDREAAARALYRASSFMPDGVDIDLRMGPNGEIIGFGYNEQTGDFEGAMPLDAQAIANLYQYHKDPAQFMNLMQERRLAAAQTAWDRAVDRRKLDNEDRDFRLKRDETVAKMAKTVAEANEIYYEMNGGASGTNAWRGDYDDYRKRLGDWRDYIKDSYSGDIPMHDVASVFFNPDVSPIPTQQVEMVGDSLISLQGKNPELTDSVVLDIAAELAMLSAMTNGLQLEDSNYDKQFETWKTERSETPRIVVDAEQDGLLAFRYNGRPYVVRSDVLMGLRGLQARQAAQQEAAAAAAAQQRRAAVPSPPPASGQTGRRSAAAPGGQPLPTFGLTRDEALQPRRSAAAPGM